MTEAQRKLIGSAKMGNLEGVESALEAGTNPDHHETAGRAAIHHAIAGEHGKIVAALLKRGADPDLKSFKQEDDGGRPLHLAGERGLLEVIKDLIANGANSEAPDNKGRTPLHWAALRSQLDSLKVLDELGCDLHAKASGRANALHFAVASGDYEVVRFLVEAGVNKDQKDKNSKYPSDVAKAKGYKEIYHYLKDKPGAAHLAPPSPSSTLTRKFDSLRKDELVLDLHGKLSRLEQEKSYAMEEAKQLREQLETQQQQHQPLHSDDTDDDKPDGSHDMNQKLLLLSHQSRDYQRQLMRAQEEVKELRQRVEEQKDQHEYEQEQEDGDVQQHLQILSHQNKEYRKKLSEHESREAELVQRAAADKQTLQDLMEETDRLKQELKQSREIIFSREQGGDSKKEVERAAGEKVAELTREVQHLTYMLEQATNRAYEAQESQKKQVSDLREAVEARERSVVELMERTREAESKRMAVQNESRERELRSQQTIGALREEVSALNGQLQQRQHQQHQMQQQMQHLQLHQPQPHETQQLQRTIQQLRDEAATNQQTIASLKQQLHKAQTQPPLQQVTPQLLQDQRRLHELTARDETHRETIIRLNARIDEMQERLKQYQKAVYGYKIRLGERERELQQSENNKKTVVDLREEVRLLTERLAMVRQRAATARNSTHLDDEVAGSAV